MPPKEHNGPGFRYEVSWKRQEIGLKDEISLDGGDDKDDDDDDDGTFVEDDDDDEKWSKLVIEDWEQVGQFKGFKCLVGKFSLQNKSFK